MALQILGGPRVPLPWPRHTSPGRGAIGSGPSLFPFAAFYSPRSIWVRVALRERGAHEIYAEGSELRSEMVADAAAPA